MPPQTTELSVISESTEPSHEPDADTQEERHSLDQAQKDVELQGQRQDIAERKTYAGRIFCLVAVWLAVVVGIVIAQGVRWPWASQYIGFDLPEAPLIALITTTTASVVGILLIVTRYLFPRRPPN